MAENSDSIVENGENNSKLINTDDESHGSSGKSDKVLKPILLEEYKYDESPESLQNFIQYLETHSNIYSRIDILVGLIYILMVESGFVPYQYKTLNNNNNNASLFEFNYKRLIDLSKQIPLNGQFNRKKYFINMMLLNLEQFEVKLIIVHLSDDLIVNCFVKGIEPNLFNVLLDPLTYFTSSNTNMKSIKFQQLDQLSRRIKNEIAFPVKYSILKQNGIIFPCLENLPPEIILIIMQKLKRIDLANFRNVNLNFSALGFNLYNKLGKKMQ